MIGVLLVNLGSPDAPTIWAVRRFLAEFLWDRRVLEMPAPFRALLLYGVILPLRPHLTRSAYEEIWTPRGSPLIFHGEDLAAGIAAELGQGWRVELAMRYGNPSLPDALDRLLAEPLDQLIVAPLYPQYASSTTGSTVERVMALLAPREVIPPVTVLPAFFDRPEFLDAVAAVARPELESFRADHVLFSFHGLPESHIRATDATKSHCLTREGCCDLPTGPARWCYKAQCVATARALAERLALPAERWSVSYQSRVGRQVWIGPSTESRLKDRCGGAKRLAILAPSFVADCLETLEELQIRGRETFEAAGGEALQVVSCVGSSPAWVSGLAGLLRDARVRRAPLT